MKDFVLCLLLSFFAFLEVASASRRMAFLIGNEHGWNKDPHLRYLVQGDIRPLAKQLRQAGFKTTVLLNKNANQIRSFLRKASLSLRQGRIDTLLLYYSGHADKTYFHVGRRSKKPLSYTEFATFVKGLPVQRKIVVVDACFSGELLRQFGSFERYKKLVRKGVRSIHRVDLVRNFSQKSKETGLKVISSSLDYSWESKELKSSVFTHYFMKALQGQGDRDKDGKITLEEVYDYIRVQLTRNYQQTPQFFGNFRRESPYPLVPAYQSKILIPKNVRGKVDIQIGNFFWSQKKVRNGALRLEVIAGKANVWLQEKGSCKRQELFIPKGREVSLGKTWQSLPCAQQELAQKGSVALEAKVYSPTYKPNAWTFGVQTGFRFTASLGGVGSAGGSIGLYHSFFSLRLGLYGGQTTLVSDTYQHLLVEISGDVGYSWNIGNLQWFVGAAFGYATTFQDLNHQARVGSLFSIGGATMLSYWFHRKWALAFRAKVGVQLGRYGQIWKEHLLIEPTLGFRYSF